MAPLSNAELEPVTQVAAQSSIVPKRSLPLRGILSRMLRNAHVAHSALNLSLPGARKILYIPLIRTPVRKSSPCLFAHLTFSYLTEL